MQNHPNTQGSAPGQNVVAVSKIFPIVVAVFVGFLTMGLPLPVLPVRIHEVLGMSTFVVGIVIGVQFVAGVLTRAWAGGLADTRGAKKAMLLGLTVASVSGLTYGISIAFSGMPNVAVGLLLVGRLLLGTAESLVVSGALTLSVALVGPKNAGKAMVWVGIAIYAAYAAGAPAGIAISSQAGFVGVAAAMVLIPLIALLVMIAVPHVAPPVAPRIPFYRVIRTVLMPGFGLALSSVGFGGITGFVAILFAARHWDNAWLAITAFGLAFIVARLSFGHLPDKIGGARVALVCVVIEALGQLLIWGSGTPIMAYAGAVLTGLGYSLAFPSFGVEAVRHVPPHNRGVAMGAYVAFLDLSLGITSPAMGALAASFGAASVYLMSAVAVALSFFVALRLMLSNSSRT
ncbi:MFS family permease [Rhodanobacter sp. K2T2]|uniref:arabinose transporter n=1 Tax=Rhodanobacter sp. K2T2 TaxID=2723085 RepID=UPI0015CD7D96|nr:arabinose transporter [Rhodanobacter sp. K2T2]NYE27612.1 MFS family permease [Rhodanobacter sp. K2T2]